MSSKATFISCQMLSKKFFPDNTKKKKAICAAIGILFLMSTDKTSRTSLTVYLLTTSAHAMSLT